MVAWLEDLNGQLDQPLAVPPNIAGFAARLRQRPSVQAMLETHSMA